jgi:GT2 family glycosyltransferase
MANSSAARLARAPFDAARPAGFVAQVSPPAVTMAVPCRDAGRHLEPLLRSLLAQTHPAVELVLVDDASRDDSVEIARRVAGPRLTVHQNAEPLGIGGNWNRCVELVRTPYFVLAHQDDVYEADYAARMLAALEAEPGAGMAHCRTMAIDADGRPAPCAAERYKQHFWRVLPAGGSRAERARHYARLWSGNFVSCPSVMFRTAAVRATGPFRGDLRFALDWDYWFRLLRSGFGIVDVDRVLLRYRRHATAATRAATVGRWRFEEELQVLGEACAAGVAAGLLEPPRRSSPALRNNLLHEALTDMENGQHKAAARKLAFVRRAAPELWSDPLVRVFRVLGRMGAPGRMLLGVGRALALRFGFGGAGG